MHIKCLVVDDEQASQKVLEHFIQKIEFIELIKVCSDTKEAFEYLQINPDINLLFLDINMPNQTGLDFYKSLQNPPKVIFTTAYSQYAVEGFEVNAIDYLLKPISYERFLVATNKAIKALNIKKEANTYIIINENKTLHKVLFSDIQFVEALGDYVKVYTLDKTITTLSTFKSFLDNLPSSFIKTHKSFCVNTNKISQISGNLIVLEDHKIPIGQTYKAEVLNQLK
jgi:DNA-binding LytR/AlgR family response regulator